MRSDRNPYFILKNSKDPVVKSWLGQAAELSHDEIQGLSIKPDVKKAMLFLKTFGDQNRSASNAELLAAKMMATTSNSAPTQKEIWQYKGASRWVRCGRTSIEANEGDYFIKDQEKIFLKHNWIKSTEPSAQAMTAESVFVEMGDFNHLNHLTKTHLNQKYPNLLR